MSSFADSSWIEAWKENRALRAFVNRVLDNRDRKGHFPKTITYRREERELRSVDRFLPAVAVKSKSDDRVVVNLSVIQKILEEEAAELGRPAPSLEALFGTISGRARRNLRSEKERWNERALEVIRDGVREGVDRSRRADGRTDDPCLSALIDGLTDAAAPLHRRLLKRARDSSFADVREAVARLVGAFLLARSSRRCPLNLDELSLAVAGDTKALRPGTEDHRRLAEELLAADPELRDEVACFAAGSKPMLHRLLLEKLGIVPNDTPLDVLVQGPLELRLDGKPLEDIRTLARAGLPSKLTYGVLRNTEAHVTPGCRVVTIENETAFRGFCRRFPDDLAVFTGGHPSWAVILLLQAIASSKTTDRYLHWGDLDRSGLLILRSLRERSSLEIEPLWMDRETFRRCADLSLRMKASEVELSTRLRETWNEPYGADLLDALVEERRWIEQESVMGRVLGLDEERYSSSQLGV